MRKYSTSQGFRKKTNISDWHYAREFTYYLLQLQLLSFKLMQEKQGSLVFIAASVASSRHPFWQSFSLR
jgi:hypothetical protein